MGIETAIIGAGVLGAGASIYGASEQSDAANSAADATRQGQQLQYDIYQQQRQDFQPYADMGKQGIAAYQQFLQTPYAYNPNSEVYQQQKGQLDRSMERRLAATGRANSTYANDTMARAYGDLATKEYNNQYARWQDQYNRTLDPIKIGQGAAHSTGQAAQNYGQVYAQGQNALANNYIQQGNNQASLYSGLGALPMQGLSLYNTMQNNEAMRNYYANPQIAMANYPPIP